MRDWKSVRVWEWESDSEIARESDYKYGTYFWAYTWKQKLFRIFQHSYISGSHLLSDIQTFFNTGYTDKCLVGNWLRGKTAFHL